MLNLSNGITLELVIRDQQIVPINVGDHDACIEQGCRTAVVLVG